MKKAVAIVALVAIAVVIMLQLVTIKNQNTIIQQQKHDSIEYIEIYSDGINVQYADGTGAYWAKQD